MVLEQLGQVTPFTIFAVEVVLILIVSMATGRANTFANIALNGILSVMAGGTLLYDGKIIGFSLLLYGIFLMSMGIKQYEEKKFLMSAPMIGKAVKVLGHYVVVSIVMLSVLAVEYLGIDVSAYVSILVTVLIGIVLL